MEEVMKTASDIARDEMMLKMQERIKAPLEWPSIKSCKIIDLQPQHYNESLRLIKRHFFVDDPMCAAAELSENAKSIDCYLEHIRIWMKDTTSLIAVSSKSQRVVGVVVARPNSEVDRSITYSRMQIHEGEVLKKIMDFKNTLVKQADPHKFFNESELFRLYVLCVHPSYRSKGLENALLEAFIELAMSLEFSVVVGLFTSGFTQELAKELGFKVLTEIRYSRWMVNDEIVFKNPGIGNYSAAFMGMLTPPIDFLKNLRRERRAVEKIEERQKKRN